MRATQCRWTRDKPDGRHARVIFALPQEQNAESPKHDGRTATLLDREKPEKHVKNGTCFYRKITLNQTI
jgi:hypothetical protein